MADPYQFPDVVHVSSCVTLKLNDIKYLLWKTQFESLLSSQKLIGFINGDVEAPAQTCVVVNSDTEVEAQNPQYVVMVLYGPASLLMDVRHSN